MADSSTGGLLSGVGSALSGATDLAKFVLGSNSTTTTSGSGTGTTNANNSASTQVQSETDTVSGTQSTSHTYQDILTGSETTSHNVSSNVIANTADPGVIASLKALAQTAIDNSNDPSKTTGLLSNILQQAGDAMTAIFGQQKQAGVYNSSATAALNNDVISRAAATAAQAVLGYQTTEQGIASDALSKLLAATSVQTQTGEQTGYSSTKGEQITDSTTNMGSLTQTQVKDSANTYTQGASSGTSSNTSQQTSQQSSGGLSIVCTWMMKHELLSRRKYYLSMVDFIKKPWYVHRGYLVVAAAMIRELERDSNSFVSRLILAVFRARTDYICALSGEKGCKKSFLGWGARALVATLCTPSSLYFWCQHVANKLESGAWKKV